MVRFIFALALIFQTLSQVDYQERRIYLSEKDNVCHFGIDSDLIRITIDSEGESLKIIDAWGSTLCTSHGLIDAMKITPAKGWIWATFDGLNLIHF
jgi:hypothetical protein